MIYFCRHPSLYGTPHDRWMKSQIETTFHDAVKTPDMKRYDSLLANFDAIHECDMGVFQQLDESQEGKWDSDTLNHIVCMVCLRKPVYLIRLDGSILRITSLKFNK